MALTIGKVARAAGVTVEAIRFYERRGLILQPPKPNEGYRLYTPAAVGRFASSARPRRSASHCVRSRISF